MDDGDDDDPDVDDTHTQVFCCNCAMVFYVPDGFHALRVKDHLTFWCPAGHGNHFAAPKAADPAVAAARVAALEAEVRQLKIDKARLTSRLDQAGVADDA
jgi:hypothetical protein